ncbi:DNA sulfur modification protein DndB [Metabacillus arenae]|uniref:Uncharacterized protein n=1 Tax=Metabacillus arenae TaxID=2771434 RepID=A0A926NE21_9BACI|nr:DNA sulfur modification protein DndB [Metabacillus arenae]MBD1379125.1 hypothetical protein [Metabacillus arenae]
MATVIFDERELDNLRKNIIDVVESIKHDKNVLNKLKRGLKEYNILPGRVQQIVNEINTQAYDLDVSELYLFANELYKSTGKSAADPSSYYPSRMSKEIKTNFEADLPDRVEFPYTFENVIKGEDDDYMAYVKASEIKKLFENGLLQYNKEVQRETRKLNTKHIEDIIHVPKVVEKSVEAMINLHKTGEWASTVITLNARLDSSDEYEELIYDEENKTLTVTKGTLLDILDGFHRINAIARVFRDPSSSDKFFKVNILNFNIGKAKQQFAQINTINPVSKSRVEEIAQSKWSSNVVERLKYNSELKGRISDQTIGRNSGLLVSFLTLSNAIDDCFEIKDKADAAKLSKYLIEFFNELVLNFPDEFLGDVAAVRKKSLINNNLMFEGYVMLAKKMKDESIPVNKLSEILNKIDFNKENPLWRDINILDETLHVKGKTKKHIYNFFEKLTIK